MRNSLRRAESLRTLTTPVRTIERAERNRASVDRGGRLGRRSLSAIILLVVATGRATAGDGAVPKAMAFTVDRTRGECRCGGGDDLNYCNESGKNFDEVFRDRGWRHQHLQDEQVDGHYWIDEGKRPALGADSDPERGADSADVALLCSHGSADDKNAVTKDPFSLFMMGRSFDDVELCALNTTDHVSFGNLDGHPPGRLRVAILETCASAQASIWNANHYRNVRGEPGVFTAWLGFHGDSIDSELDAGQLRRYVTRSFSAGLGSNWLDSMYRHYKITTRDGQTLEGDQCPVAILFCDAKEDCDRTFEHGGFDERATAGGSPGTGSVQAYYYIEGCAPIDGPVMNAQSVVP